MQTHLLAVRHGHAHWQPDEMRPLSARGLADAEVIPARAAGLTFDAIYASPFTRARQTVEPLAREHGLPILELPDLRERELGDIGDLPFSAAALRTWQEPSFAFPGGESNQQAQARGVATVRLLLRQHACGRIAVGAHGTLLALIFRHFDPRYDHAFWTAMSMPDLHLLTFEGDRLCSLERLWVPT